MWSRPARGPGRGCGVWWRPRGPTSNPRRTWIMKVMGSNMLIVSYDII